MKRYCRVAVVPPRGSATSESRTGLMLSPARKQKLGTAREPCKRRDLGTKHGSFGLHPERFVGNNRSVGMVREEEGGIRHAE